MQNPRGSKNLLLTLILILLSIVIIICAVLVARNISQSPEGEDRLSLQEAPQSDAQAANAQPNSVTPPVLTLGEMTLRPDDSSDEVVTWGEEGIPLPSLEGTPLDIGAVTLQLTSAEKATAFEGGYEELMAADRLPYGLYSAELVVSFDTPTAEGFEGSARYTFSLDIPKPAPSVTLEGPGLTQGRTALLRMSGFDEQSRPTITTDFGFTPTPYRVGEDWIAYIAAPYSKAVGTYNITVTAQGQTYPLQCEIADGGFVVDEPFWVEIGPGVDAAAANAEFSAVTNPLKAVGDDTIYWQDGFVVPLDGERTITSYYGHTRTINGSTSKHSGVDLAAPIGTPVYAPQAGRVQLARWLDLTGYTVCIEHGYGLKTWFYHLDGVNTEEGAMVAMGDQVATVGSTGIYTTGPHLHWGMTVFGTFVDPNQFVNDPLLP